MNLGFPVEFFCLAVLACIGLSLVAYLIVDDWKERCR